MYNIQYRIWLTIIITCSKHCLEQLVFLSYEKSLVSSGDSYNSRIKPTFKRKTESYLGWIGLELFVDIYLDHHAST